MSHSSAGQRALLKLISSMLIFGTIGIFRRYIPLGSGMLACVRGMLGSGFLIVLLLLRGNSLRFDIRKTQLLLLCLSGAAIGFNWILLFEAYNYTSIAIATLCYYMQPTIVILLSPLFFGERLSGKKLICVIVSIVGIALVSGITDTKGIHGDDAFGIAMGLGAAALYALVIILNKKNPVEDAYGKTIVQLLSASVVMLPYLLLTAGFSVKTLSPTGGLLLLIVGIVHTGFAYALYFSGMNDLRAQTVAILSYIDPIFAILLAAIFLQEPMTLVMILGAVLVLGASVCSELEGPST